MELKDLHPGDKVVVWVNPDSPSQWLSDRMRNKSFSATVVIIDSIDLRRDVAIGWSPEKGEPLPFPFAECGPGSDDRSRLPDFEKYMYLWVNHEDIQSKDGSASAGTGATCACGYDNPYASSPYVCTGCKLWEHVAR
jgi:hypothetical protein